MADYGATPEGWEAKRLADILDETGAELAEIVDPKTGNRLNPDFNSDDPAMQIVQVPLNQTAEGWEAAQLAYNQFNPLLAVGPAVDGLLTLTGISRLPSTPTILSIEMTGTAGATVLAGQTISDVFDSNLFTTDQTVTFDVSGVATATATATVNGPIIVTNGTITKIKTPQPSWDGVTNVDTQAEVRRRRSNAAPSAAPSDSVQANLANLEGVTFARVKINNTLTTDADGIPAKQQACIVLGGNDTEIAKTILQRSGCTAEFFGDIEVILFDAQGEPNPVRFSRPTQITMTVDVDITVVNSAIYPTDGDQQIKDNIVLYSLEGADAFGITDGFDQNGFPPGTDVIVSRLYTPVNQVPGHRINSITVNGSTTQIPIAFNEVAIFDASNITVTVS
jgi:uncharacterized phage protein gp47/JayE